MAEGRERGDSFGERAGSPVYPESHFSAPVMWRRRSALRSRPCYGAGVQLLADVVAEVGDIHQFFDEADN